METSEAVEIERSGPVTTFTISRPGAKNALDMLTVRQLKQAFREFDDDPQQRVGVIYGSGGAFCAGADLKELSTGTLYDAWAGDETGWLGAPLSKPLLAAVEGHAVAGGLGLALYCDIRIADVSAIFGVYCRRFGVPMSDGTTVRLPRLIGESRAMAMMLTGRGVGAEEALSCGLVTEVVPAGQALTRTNALAQEIARFPQVAMCSDRQSVLQSRGQTLGAALRNEAALAQAAKQLEAQAGAKRFATGKGRHGGFENV
ncbi:MAG: enoyl-CoA hydratase [Gammaproteobacteria bacterium]